VKRSQFEKKFQGQNLLILSLSSTSRAGFEIIRKMRLSQDFISFFYHPKKNSPCEAIFFLCMPKRILAFFNDISQQNSAQRVF